jgi:hypothetical protein
MEETLIAFMPFFLSCSRSCCRLILPGSEEGRFHPLMQFDADVSLQEEDSTNEHSSVIKNWERKD